MNRTRITIASLILVLGLANALPTPCSAADVETRLVDAPPPQPNAPHVWPSNPPADCPFVPSSALARIGFTGRHAEYTNADTWYLTWAADNKMYSPWTDGNVNGLQSGSIGPKATTGYATVIGDDPMALQVVDQGEVLADPSPYRGRYPCGSLVHNGVWYYGTYCLGPHEFAMHDGRMYDLPWLGPLVGFRWSTDMGKTWTETPCTTTKPLFGENELQGAPVKIGAAHFVDFGKGMEHSPDGKAYLVSHGASDSKDRRYGYDSWITGDEIYLIRVTPSIENMNDASKYEFFAGNDAGGQPVWSHDFSKIKPIATWRDNMGCVTMTYDAPLKKYLMCVTDGGNTFSYYNTYILESDQITGPWKLVSYMKHFGEQSYFVNIPSKFISADGSAMWLCYAANFGQDWGGTHFEVKPAASRYAMCLHEIKLLPPPDPKSPPNELDSPDNIARVAKATASSSYDGYTADGAIDGFVGGFPADITQEWAAHAEGEAAMLRLTWDHEETVDRVILFDRPNNFDQIKSGMILFSDGTTIKTGELPDDAMKGLEVRFPARKIKWLAFFVTETDKCANIGLSEIAVFRAKK